MIQQSLNDTLTLCENAYELGAHPRVIQKIEKLLSQKAKANLDFLSSLRGSLNLLDSLLDQKKLDPQLSHWRRKAPLRLIKN